MKAGLNNKKQSVSNEINNELHTAELLLIKLHQHIANRSWETGLGGKRVFIYKPRVNEKGEEVKNIVKKITVPHHVYHQLRVIESYLQIRTNHQKPVSLDELNVKAQLALTKVFKEIPEHAIRPRSAISQFFKNATRYNATHEYYELFTLHSKDNLLKNLGLEQHQAVIELLDNMTKQFKNSY